MRLKILLILLVAVIFGSGFWATVADPVCRTPVYYYINDVDDRFGTSKDELKRITKNAELLWENQLGENLFEYKEGEGLPINLIFDERQRNSNIEEALRERIDAKEGMNDEVAMQYENLIKEFTSLKGNYENRVSVYESDLQRYNSQVVEWNEKGGVPQNQIEALREEQERLEEEKQELETQAKEINAIVSQLNVIGARGNTLITDYNKIVEEYNTRFSDIHEYTQGDHSTESINIYQFNTEEELTIVLAHEMGHALNLGHVENEESIMHRLMGEQSVSIGLTQEDISEFNNVCEEKSFATKLLTLFKNVF